MGAYMYEYLDQDPEWQDIIIDVDNNNISFENIEVTIPQYSEEGTWTLSNISASDAIGNYIEIYRDDDGNYVTEGVDEAVSYTHLTLPTKA